MTPPLPLVLVAALDRQRAIGRGGRLPWHLPDDLRRFRELTTGTAVLMGRRTAESLGRALPRRRNLVLTRSGRAPWPGMEPVPDLTAALAAVSAAPPEVPLVSVVGGGEVYALCLPLAERLELTLVDTEVAGADAWFPPWRREEWDEVARVEHPADERHAWPFAHVSYARAVPGRPGPRG